MSTGAVNVGVEVQLKRRLLLYGGLAACLLAPGIWRAGGGIPGAPRSDLWNSLWSMWFMTAQVPGAHTELLNHPEGGVLLVTDPLNSLLFLPFTMLAGAAVAWTLCVWVHLVFAAGAADAFARDLGAKPEASIIAGVSFGAAPLLLSAVHNGTSEALAWGWLPLGLLALRRALQRPTTLRFLAAIFALAATAYASAYLAIAAWMAAVIVVLASPRKDWIVGFGALGFASILVLPWAWKLHEVATMQGNLVGIKDPIELGLVRRTMGAVDPSTFFIPGGYYSPDFSEISRYDEMFVHSPYIGWVWLVAAVVGAWGSRRWELGVFGLLGAALACGPVLVHDATAVLLSGNLGIPLPYFAVETLPLFESMSLVYRLSVLASLAVALYAALAVPPRYARWVALAGIAEILLLSPVRGGPDASPIPDPAPFHAIAAGEAGAVMNFPIVGGRPYLYEATLHGRPVAGSLNFPENPAARAVLSAGSELEAERAVTAVQRSAERFGIRYLVLHRDPLAHPGPYDETVQAIEGGMAIFAKSDTVRVYQLW